MQIGIYPDINSLSHEAAQFIVRLANEATVSRGRFSIALSGGSTPNVLYGLFATEPYLGQINWPSVEIFWADERCVPPDDAESNYAMAKEVLLSKIPILPKKPTATQPLRNTPSKCSASSVPTAYQLLT